MVYEVLARYFFSAPTKWAFEMAYMLMGTSFMFGIAYCMQMGRHIRVDFVYDHVSLKKRQVIDLAGCVFLVPMLLWLTWGVWEYFADAYRADETSGESAWNPIIWPFKFSLVAGMVLLFLQTTAQVVQGDHGSGRPAAPGAAAGGGPEMSAEFALWMFPALMIMIFMGFPVAFSLLSVAFVFGALRFNFSPFAANVFAQKVDQVAAAYVLGAVPLFIFMGSLMERSGIAERLFEAIHLWTRRLPGGLAVGTVILCVIFAAASGVVGATESVVGLLAIPVMLRYAYDKGLISGTICAGGSLGTVIPPSVIVVILGPVAEVDVGGLFMGMLFPGLLLAGLFILYILVRCTIRPQDGQRLPPDENDPSFARKLVITAIALVPPLILIFAVLGTILLGWATPTEAAAMGAAGSIIMVLLYGNFTWGVLKEALVKTLLVTAMILMILLAGNIFATVFAIAGGMVTTQDLVESAGLSGWATMGLLLLLAFLAGFVLDLISIILIIIPIAMPIIESFTFHDLAPNEVKSWFCILFLIVIQTSYLTPPMAPAIFYLRGISPPEIRLGHMYRGVLPFIALEIIALAMVMQWPDLALWLPEQMLRFRD